MLQIAVFYSFLLLGNIPLSVCGTHIRVFLNQLSVAGHLGCFHVWALYDCRRAHGGVCVAQTWRWAVAWDLGCLCGRPVPGPVGPDPAPSGGVGRANQGCRLGMNGCVLLPRGCLPEPRGQHGCLFSHSRANQR